MTTVREIIARHLCTMAAQGWSAISPFERAAYRTTAAGMVEAVTSAGFRVLGPDDLDEKTVERCAEVADEHTKAGCTTPDGSQTSAMRLGAASIAAMIRVLKGENQ